MSVYELPTLVSVSPNRIATFNLGQMIGCTVAPQALYGRYLACTADGQSFLLTKAQRDSLLRQINSKV